jgi:predicted Zn-dependent peptidase
MIMTTTLPSGLRVVTEDMPAVASVAIGCWVAIGSRDESDQLAGASHFLEHLVFKGTERWAAKAIAQAVEARGGEMNAFTSREHTAYYLRLPADELDFAVALLRDVLSEPALRPPEVDAEREVILEELALAEDTPDDKVHGALAEALYPDHPMGRETLGTEASIEAMEPADIDAFRSTWYQPCNVIVAAAGRIEHDVVVEALDGFLGDGSGNQAPARQAPASIPVPEVTVNRPGEQAHIAYGWRSFDHADPDRHALAVANEILGGGMSSRLFQEVREERGLAYSVYSSAALASDTGMVSVYAGTTPSKEAAVRDVIQGELDKLLEHGITDTELEVAVGSLVGSIMLGLEDSGSRMGRLGRNVLARNEVTTVDEHVVRVRRVTVADVNRVIERIFSAPRSVAVVGPHV